MEAKKIKQTVLRFLGNHLMYFAVNVLCKTLRFEIENPQSVKNLIDQKQNFVVAFWHGTMLVPWYLHRRKNFAALVSQSKDGEILTRLLSKWKYQTARGSSTIGGKEALNILLQSAENGYSVAVTPDGPTGPPHKMKAGAVITAKKSRIPLILCAAANKNYWELKSWDKFQIPKFFTKVNVIYSDPILIDPELNYEETSNKIIELENELNLMTKKATKF